MSSFVFGNTFFMLIAMYTDATHLLACDTIPRCIQKVDDYCSYFK